MSASLADWALEQFRLLMPDELIFDAVRGPVTFDKKPAAADESRYVILYCPRPSHDVVTLKPGKDRVDVTFTVHSFGTTRREADWRSQRVALAVKNKVPIVTGYEFGLVSHPISRLERPNYAVPLQLYAVDQFDVGGFEI